MEEWAKSRQPELERQREAQAAALSSALDSDAAQRLYDLMSEISEDVYCAGWMVGNEFTLWAMHEGGSREYGIGTVGESDVAELKRLSEKAGGWWRWTDDNGPMFTTLSEWLGVAKVEGR